MTRWGFVLLIFCGFSFAGDAPDTDSWNLFWGSWKLPSKLTHERVGNLLQKFSYQQYGKAYRYLGEEGDFFHGHLLVEERIEGENRRLIARAILYHTQEDAYGVRWKTKAIDPKFDYLDHGARNWIQWLNDSPIRDGEKIENARRYIDTSRKKEIEFEDVIPVEGRHYTIHSHQLDDQKLGFNLFGDLSFNFFKAPCLSPILSAFERGPLWVASPDDEVVCLKVQTPQMMVETSTFRK